MAWQKVERRTRVGGELFIRKSRNNIRMSAAALDACGNPTHFEVFVDGSRFRLVPGKSGYSVAKRTPDFSCSTLARMLGNDRVSVEFVNGGLEGSAA